jgi:hypothetical protein
MDAEDTDARAAGEVKRHSVVLPAAAEVKPDGGAVVAERLGAMYSVLIRLSAEEPPLAS